MEREPVTFEQFDRLKTQFGISMNLVMHLAAAIVDVHPATENDILNWLDDRFAEINAVPKSWT